MNPDLYFKPVPITDPEVGAAMKSAKYLTQELFSQMKAIVESGDRITVKDEAFKLILQFSPKILQIPMDSFCREKAVVLLESFADELRPSKIDLLLEKIVLFDFWIQKGISLKPVENQVTIT